MEKKQVTLFVGSLAGGGAEGVCVTVANGLAQNEWDVTLVILNLKNAVNLVRLDPKVKLIDLKVSQVRYSFRSTYKYFRNNKSPVLVFDHLLSTILILARKASRSKFKIISRNINTLSLEMKNYKSFFYRFIASKLIHTFYPQVDYVINQSQGMQDDLISMYPALKDKTSFIHNPVNEKFQYFTDAIPELNSRQYFLCVGRLERQKALHKAIKAFSIFQKSHPQFRLKIIGIGSQLTSLTEIAKDLGVLESIDFLGFEANVLPYYLNARSTLLTSLYEGFPNVLVESISVGTPVISFDCKSGPSEIIVEGLNGYLIKEDDIDSFALSMNKLISSNLNSESIIRSSKPFQIQSIIKKYEEIIIRLSK